MNWKMSIKQHFEELVHVIYPNCCGSCGGILVHGEFLICGMCRMLLPITGYHLVKDNKIEKIFWGRTPVERAASYLFFNKGTGVQRLMHELKYKQSPEIGILLGEMYGLELKRSGWLEGIDFICPVPLHPKKFKKRGYNQSACFAEGISKVAGIPVDMQWLQRRVFTSTQTRKNRIERWHNVETAFSVEGEPKFLKNGQVLLIDDIITTGATLEACASLIGSKIGNRVSIATIASTF